MEDSSHITAVVGDTQPIFLDGLVRAITGIATVLAAVDDGPSALAAIRLHRPSVAILDYRMPALDGGQIAERVDRDGLPTRVVVISTDTDSTTVYRAFQQGAAAYLTKRATAQEVVEAVVAAAEGRYVLPPELTAGLVKEIRQRGASETPQLSERESQILHLLARGSSVPAISKELYLASTTVKSHVQRVYEKLGVSSRAAAIAEAMRRGVIE